MKAKASLSGKSNDARIVNDALNPPYKSSLSKHMACAMEEKEDLLFSDGFLAAVELHEVGHKFLSQVKFHFLFTSQ